MAFRKERLEEIGGFDVRFHTAGDDVDVCWRLREREDTLGFHAGALVWHQRRGSVRAYWRQQRGYGYADALLERKWPEKYNVAGHVGWRGRVYGDLRARFGRRRVNYGVWGTEMFQALYEPGGGVLSSLPLMPEWYLVVGLLTVVATGGALWTPALAAAPLAGLALAISVAQALTSASRARFTGRERSPVRRMAMCALTTLLHLLHPAARLTGRLRGGLSPWRRRVGGRFQVPRRRAWSLWSDEWDAPEERLRHLESRLRARGVAQRRGDRFGRWDLEVRGGLIGGARALMAVEEHGHGHQLVRLRVWPRCSTAGWLLVISATAVASVLGLTVSWADGAVAGCVVPLVLLAWVQQSGSAAAVIAHSFRSERPDTWVAPTPVLAPPEP
jgi:hypothetical protein